MDQAKLEIKSNFQCPEILKHSNFVNEIVKSDFAQAEKQGVLFYEVSIFLKYIKNRSRHVRLSDRLSISDNVSRKP